MVDSVDDLKSWCSIRGIRTPDFWSTRLRRWLPALNRIIHNSHFRRRGQSGGTQRHKKRTVSLRGRQIAYLIYEYFRVTGEPMLLSRTMPTYSQLLFEMIIFRNSIRSGTEFYYSMTKIPSDDVLEGLCKFKNTRVWETQNRNGIVQYWRFIRRKQGPDYHRLKTIVTRSIEQDLRNKNFGARKRKLWKKRRGQRIRGQNSVDKGL